MTGGTLRVFVGQAGDAEDEFSKAFEAAERWEFRFLCPTCGERQPWRWEAVKHDTGGASMDWKRLAESVRMVCGCGAEFMDKPAPSHYPLQPGNRSVYLIHPGKEALAIDL